jgi:hypothetical protein
MQTDRYTRVVLTIIPAALVVNAGRGFLAIPEARASDTLHCKIDDEVKISGKVELDTFSRPVDVKLTDPVEVRNH